MSKAPRRDPRTNPATAHRDAFGGPWAETRETIGRAAVPCRVYSNTVWRVVAHEITSVLGELTCLAVSRQDGGTVRNWRHLQRLKNELCGPEREAVELFPAESRLVDSCNNYYLWVLPEGARLPFGHAQRMIVSGGRVEGLSQEPFEDGQTPPDAVTPTKILERYKR